MIRTALSLSVALGLAAAGCSKQDALAADAEASLRRLFDGSAPQLAGPLQRLEFGMEAKDAAKAAPDLGKGFAVLDDYPGLQFSYYLPEDTGRVASARVVVSPPSLDLAELLTELWGAPVEGEDLRRQRLFWFDPQTRLRATVWQGFGRSRQLLLEPYLPYDVVLEAGSEPGHFGFDHPQLPLLGASVRPVLRRYKPHRRTAEGFAGKAANYLEFPPTEFALAFLRVHLTVDDRHVTALRFGLEYAAVPAAKEEIRSLLVTRFGPPQGGGDVLRWDGPPVVSAEADDGLGMWEVNVTVGSAPP